MYMENKNNGNDEDGEGGSSSSSGGSSNGDDGGGGGPNDPGDPGPDQDPDVAREPPIQVPPFGFWGGDPDGEDEEMDIPAQDEHPMLRNLYLRVWVQYAFKGATQDATQAALESHKSLLLAGVTFGGFPAELVAQIHQMPTTLRSLERRLALDFSDLLTIYCLCPDCGKRYTMEEVNGLRTPQCTRHVAQDRCTGELYTEKRLADGTMKRTPTKSFPYNSLPAAISRILSRRGMVELIQHWRRDDDVPVEYDVPCPLDAADWYERVDLHTLFGDITEAWGWESVGTGLRRTFDGENYVDVPTHDDPLSLSRLPLGLNLGMNMDGFRAFKGKFASGNGYSVNGLYIIINNLPFHQRTLIENMILAIALPGPTEPKGYAFDQILEPLVDDLIALAEGVNLPVFNPDTGRVEPRPVYANLTAVIVDWIARIKCIGHVGVTAEHNHCPYCKIRACLLSVPRGFDANRYDYRDPHEHLQLKHEYLRAPELEREEIRLENGTIFTEFDRIPGFYAPDNCPIDIMHLCDLGMTPAIISDFIFKMGMLRPWHRNQPHEETPVARFDAFVQRTVFPWHCGRLPTSITSMNRGTKAEQWRNLLLILPGALFEAWRIGDAIPNNNVPRGGRNTTHFKAQRANSERIYRRRIRVHEMDEGDLEEMPELEDCGTSRNPRDFYANILRYCIAYAGISQHRLTRDEINEATELFEQVGAIFAQMNINLPPIFHAATHVRDHLLQFGNIYGTHTAPFERANRILINTNTNGHGHGVLEATMARGFMRRAESHRFVKLLLSIQDPTDDDRHTAKVLLDAMKNGPAHEIHRGMLDAILAGEARFHPQERLRLATTPAKVDFMHTDHQPFFAHMIRFCNSQPHPFDADIVFYGLGRRPRNGRPVCILPTGSTIAYPHFTRFGIRYGTAGHHRGHKARYGYITGNVPVIVRGIYETTVQVDEQEHKFLAVMVQHFCPKRD
ncbi:similar to KIAA0564 protein [Rhizoctonia solani AG-1 IB]|nr:similar to KIAA0564 protein [Rhizoctonia solani AG-1 IB]